MPESADFRPEKSTLRSTRADLRPEISTLRLQISSSRPQISLLWPEISPMWSHRSSAPPRPLPKKHLVIYRTWSPLGLMPWATDLDDGPQGYDVI